MADNYDAAEAMALDLAEEEDPEGAGQGHCPSLEPSDLSVPATHLGFMNPCHGSFPATTMSRQVPFVSDTSPLTQLGAAPQSLIDYNSKRATQHYAANIIPARGITLVLLGSDTHKELLPLTLLDSGANTSIVTRQYCQANQVPYKPCALKLNTASGSVSPVSGRVLVEAQVVFAINTSEEAHAPLTLFVVEGSIPAVFELLLSTEVLRVMGADVPQRVPATTRA